MDGDIALFDGQPRFFRREIAFRADEDGDIQPVVYAQGLLDGNALRVAFEAVGDEFQRFLRRLGLTKEILDGDRLVNLRDTGLEGLFGAERAIRRARSVL